MSDDPTPIPNWLDDPEEIAPCPCGDPPDDSCMLVKGSVPLFRWFHQECFGFLEKEMNEEEIIEKREWEKLMQKWYEGQDNE